MLVLVVAVRGAPRSAVDGDHAGMRLVMATVSGTASLRR